MTLLPIALAVAAGNSDDGLAQRSPQSPKPIGWLAWAAVAMLCLVAAVYFYGRQRDYAHQMIRMREEMRRQNIELTRFREAAAILGGAGTREAAFDGGKVYVNSDAGVLLIGLQLPPAPRGRTYRMWVLPKSGSPVPAGFFRPDADGTALHVRSGPIDLAATGAIAVTVEDETGSAQASKPVLVAPLAAAGR